jgi:hypothetical protein
MLGFDHIVRKVGAFVCRAASDKVCDQVLEAAIVNVVMWLADETRKDAAYSSLRESADRPVAR